MTFSVIVELDVTTEQSAVEDLIVNEFASLMMKSTAEEKEKILQKINQQLQDGLKLEADGLNLIGLVKQNSIGIFVFCRSMSTCRRLHSLVESNATELKSALESVLAAFCEGDTISIEAISWCGLEESAYCELFSGKLRPMRRKPRIVAVSRDLIVKLYNNGSVL
jgi:hypothetical protein